MNFRMHHKLFYSSFGRFAVSSELQCCVGVCLISSAFFMTLFLTSCKCWGFSPGALQCQQFWGLAELGELTVLVFLLLYFSKKISGK